MLSENDRDAVKKKKQAAQANRSFFPIFAFELVLPFLVKSGKIKRESGVNPGQARCCETLSSFRHTLLPLVYREGVEGRVSQKTYHFMVEFTSSWIKDVKTGIIR